MKLILLFIISSSLFSKSFLTFPNTIDLGKVKVTSKLNTFFEVKNETKDTFYIENIKEKSFIPYEIWLKGKQFNLNSRLYTPNIIYPNQTLFFEYEINSNYEDSISLSGGKLKVEIEFQYIKYGKDSIIISSFDILFSCRKKDNDVNFLNIRNTLDIQNCPNSEYPYPLLGINYLKNQLEGVAILDSLKWKGGDTIVNYYGLINDNGFLVPEIINDSIPYKLLNSQLYSIGWFYKNIGFYEKKVYLNAYITTFENKHIVLFDSIEVRIQQKNEGDFNVLDKINAKLNLKSSFKNKISIRGCSNNILYLDSITFSDWSKDELQIYSDLGFPIRLDRGFNYSLSFDFTPKKTGEIRGRIKAHFRDEAGNYFYRYDYLTTIVEEINDVALTKENPLAFYPNPVNSLATLMIDEEPSMGEQVGIYNSLGTLVKTFEVSDKFIQVNTEGFAEGIYIARLLWSGKSVKFCVVR